MPTAARISRVTSKSGCWSATKSSKRFSRARPAPRGSLPRNVRTISARRPAAGFRPRPYATDAQHVSVEFVHPVIVGKRALPALDLSALFRPWLEAIFAPEDIVMGFGPPEGDPEVWAALPVAHERGRDDLRASPVSRGSYALEAATAGSLHAPGDDRNPLSHALGDRARLLRAPRTGPRRRRCRISVSVSRARKAGNRPTGS